MPEQNLNPDALRVATDKLWEHHVTYEGLDIGYDEAAELVVSTYLAALPAQPELQENSKPNQNLEFDTVNSVPGVYDIGSTEPEGIDQVVECDELGHPYVREWDDDADYTWSKTTEGTRWKGYKNGKEYLEWPELVRRYGPVRPVEG